MASLAPNLRKGLENAVKKARRAAKAGAQQVIEQLAVGHHEPWSTLTPEQCKLRNQLRAHGRQVGDRLDERKGTQSIDRLIGECAYEHWHRLLFARFLAENDLLVEPESGVALSLGECRELARERGVDWLVLASDFAQRMLPQIFRVGDPVLELTLPPEHRQELEGILEGLPSEIFTADDSLGWVYQFWQAEQKKAVNDAENKIGADELPAVTQLFTDNYMVLFLLHNTLGAWWAGKVLTANPKLARSASSEDECRVACAVPGVEWSYLRFVREGKEWRPAAGTFPEWPMTAKGITVLDPCMGSGHFLAFALPILIALRQAEEKLSVSEAIDAVLRDNLFGLELDPRCTQIAAFNVALCAWKLSGYRPLPPLHLACSGFTPGTSKVGWLRLAQKAAQELSSGDDELFPPEARNGMEALYDLFVQAPVLGSLIEPRQVDEDLLQTSYEKLEPVFQAMLGARGSDEMREAAVAAQGMAKAAEILGSTFTLVATNVPYLGRGEQDAVLAGHCERHFDDAKTDLATCFVRRIQLMLGERGTAALVTPQNWLTQDFYTSFRRRFLVESCLNIAINLGPGAFTGVPGEVVKALLVVFGVLKSKEANVFPATDEMQALDADAKAAALRVCRLVFVEQGKQLLNRKHRIQLGARVEGSRLLDYAIYSNGIQTGDSPRFLRAFPELARLGSKWAAQQTTVDTTTAYGGMTQAVLWEDGAGTLLRFVREKLDSDNTGAWLRGNTVWGRRGVLVSAMGKLHVSLYLGTLFDDNSVAIVPEDEHNLQPVWAACSDPSYPSEVRKIDKKLNVRGPLVEIPFDIGKWRASEDVPAPSSSDPTQWIFSGHPRHSDAPLQVAVARLVGYRWPRQTGSSFISCPALGPDGLESRAAEDGIACLPALRGEPTAEERVRALLADAYAAEWSATKLSELLASVDFTGRSLGDWLRDGFFEQHCALFHNRPFVWQVWDGRRDGFSALVNYHSLAGPNGEGRRTLEKLTHTYLGDWLKRQRDDQKAGVEGADGRVAAAEHLKRELENILEGEPPYDLFVRWKPLSEQPIGWEPDLDDGVRINIRPFMNGRGKNACILRVAPKIKWGKDRGKEPSREQADFPWLWSWDEQTPDFPGGAAFDGNRWNDLHYSRERKLAAREGKP